MDKGSQGVVGRFTGYAAIIATITFLLAGVGAFYGQVSGINRNLDRNLNAIRTTCLALKQIDTDLRIHIYTTDKKNAKEIEAPPSALVLADC